LTRKREREKLALHRPKEYSRLTLCLLHDVSGFDEIGFCRRPTDAMVEPQGDNDGDSACGEDPDERKQKRKERKKRRSKGEKLTTTPGETESLLCWTIAILVAANGAPVAEAGVSR
jgi:hypothetical protein